MDDLASIVKGVTRISLVIMGGLLLGWSLHPETRIYTLGMALGMVAGIGNTSYLSMKIRNLAQAIASNGRAFGLGFLTRLCFSILVVMFSVKIEHFSLEATVAGLFIPQILTVPVAIYFSVSKKK